MIVAPAVLDAPGSFARRGEPVMPKRLRAVLGQSIPSGTMRARSHAAAFGTAQQPRS
jgi:hypothetical protein